MPQQHLTPMMEQYQQMKTQYPDCILFFRLGDFYEMFGEDAKEASKILDIVLTARNKGEHRTEMCGVPYHAAENYLAKLTKTGKKVAICEQVSDPSLPGIVKREVIRIVTPGTTLSANLLEEKSNNYIVCLYPKGLSFADLTTGEFKVTEIMDYENLRAEFERISPKECIIQKQYFESMCIVQLKKEFGNTHFFSFENSENGYQILTDFFKTKSLAGFGAEKLPFGIQAAGTLLKYLLETQKNELKHIKKLVSYHKDEAMFLDDATIRNLELLFTQRDGSKKGSLLGVLDETITAMGGRLLRKWLLSPLVKLPEIQNRLDAVDECFHNQNLSEDLTFQLKKIHDLERLLSRLSLGTGNARDLIALKISLQVIPEIIHSLEQVKSKLLKNIQENLNPCEDLVELIEKAVEDEPPAIIREGGMIKDGYSEELDELRKISRGGQKYIEDIQTREVTRTGINSLKVGFNRVFGYYIEISKTHAHKAPQDYIRKQTLVSAERYITPELKEHEEKVLQSQEKIVELEYTIFQKLREKVLEHIREIQKTAQEIAMLDVLLDFTRIALMNNYCKPYVYDGSKIEIKDGRHPVVEKIGMQRFVPNDTLFDKNENRFLLITGPNMAGKSVYLRQVAHITLMAHMGSFVPARESTIGLIDRIFTRVGASDDLARGQSTFMVEMQETANILNHATEKSLIILDEIGRGTSTYDGVSIAWAVTEYIHETIKARTIFATHYHELIAVVDRLKGAKNLSAMVKETMEGIIFLYKIQKGGVDRSYGIEVARLAALPTQVTKRAQQILEELEENIVEKGIKENLMKRIANDQMNLFATNREKGSLQQLQKGRFTHPALEDLKKMDINTLTPLEALKKLDALKAKLKDS